MEEIGNVVLLQVQRSRLKVMRDSALVYDPEPLLEVSQLRLTQNGIIGVGENESNILDVHHRYHPKTRNRNQSNGISFGLSYHYQEMQDRFGEHMVNGVGGENMIIETHHPFPFEKLGNWIAIKNHETGELTYLNNIMAAAPCVEFSRFASQRPLSNGETKSTLQFLDNGRRGYYATLDQFHTESLVEIGDCVYTFDVS